MIIAEEELLKARRLVRDEGTTKWSIMLLSAYLEIKLGVKNRDVHYWEDRQTKAKTGKEFWLCEVMISHYRGDVWKLLNY